MRQKKSFAFFFVALLALCFVNTNAYTQELYVITKSNSRLNKLNKNTSGSAEVLISSINSPSGLVVEPNSGDIYYVFGSPPIATGGILRTNRDGTNPTTIVSGRAGIKSIALDPVNSVLYFIENTNSTPTISSIRTDGTNMTPNIISGFDGGGPIDLDVDPVNGKIYWTDSRGASIRRASTNGTSEETISDDIPTTLSGIAFDRTNNAVYWINGDSQSIDYVSNFSSLPITPSIAVTNSLIGAGGLTLDETQNPLEFFLAVNNNSVIKAFFNSSAVQLLNLAQGASQPTDIALFNVAATPTPTATATPDPILRPTTQISIAPPVSVTGKTALISLVNFTTAINQASAEFLRSIIDYKNTSSLQKLASNKLVIRYDLRVTAPKKKDNRKILSKKNEVTLKNLKPGNYSVNYSAAAFTKKSKEQIAKAKSDGKTGFTATHKKVFSTNVSPSSSFTIQ